MSSQVISMSNKKGKVGGTSGEHEIEDGIDQCLRHQEGGIQETVKI
jgi:hypothetical protein